MTNWHGEAPVGRTHEWYTPPSLFEAMGAIFDLDPAMPSQPVEGKRIPLVALEAHEGTAPVPWVPARRWYTPVENGLLHVIDDAREQLRERLAVPDDTGRVRRRLEARRERLAQLYAWGDIPEAQYRADRADVERELRLLPSEDRLILFDQHRQLITSLAEEVMEADLDMLRTLAQRVVAYAWADGRELGAVIPTGPALPFFDAVAMAPPDGSEPPVGTAWPDDVLIWFAA